MIKEKKATLTNEEIIFIILNISFFLMMLLFIFSQVSSGGIKEKQLAKKVALIIDSAGPVSTIYLNAESYSSLAKTSKINPEEIIQINDKEKFVTVRLSSSGGYSFPYFSDYKVTVKYNKETQMFILAIEEK